MSVNRKILVVDDDNNLRKTLSNALRFKGYVPIPVSTGIAAMDKLGEERPSVALIDLRLLDMCGLELMKEIKKSCPTTECIVMTGHATEQSAIEAINLGAYSYVQKPHDINQLLITIDRAREKQEAQKALEQSEALLRATGRMAKVGGWEIDAATKEISWTEETHRIHEVPLDYKPPLDRAIGFYHPDDRPKLRGAIQQALEHGEPYDMEIRLITAKGKPLWIRTVCEPQVVDGKTVKLTGTFQDITERRKSDEEIRHLTKRLLSAAEQERQSIARDLHDEFGQILTALQLGMETVRNSIPEEMKDRKLICDELVELIRHTGDKIREISSALHPALLDHMGLVPALRQHVHDTCRRNRRMQIDFQAIDSEKRFPSEIELVSYRVFQEAMNNIAKHSQASRVRVTLSHSDPELVLMVEDDGVGFDPGELSGSPDKSPQGIGLLGMRERILSVGGTIDILSSRNKGTQIRATLPAL